MVFHRPKISICFILIAGEFTICHQGVMKKVRAPERSGSVDSDQVGKKIVGVSSGIERLEMEWGVRDGNLRGNKKPRFRWEAGRRKIQ
jgi:hypothetical protein